MTKMSHPIEQEELMAYLDGELAPDRATTAAAHFEKCRECQNLAGDLQSVSRRLMAWQVELPDDLRMSQAIGAALEERDPKKAASPALRSPWQTPRRRWRPLRIGGGIAAGLVALLLVGAILTPNLLRVRRTQYYLPPRGHAASQSADTGKFSGEYGAGGGGSLVTQSSPGVAADSNGFFHGIGDHAENSFSVDGQPVVSGLPAKPMVARTAGLSLTTKEFDNARAAMEETLKRHSGYIGQLNVSAPAEGGRTLTATLRVPSDQLEATMTELKKLGRVENEAQAGEEVTEQYVDLQARLTNARNTEQQLTEILRQRTGKLSDVLAVEVEISRVRGQIEQMEAERKNLVHRVDFATLNTTLTEEYEGQLHAVPVSTFTRIRNAAVDGYETLTETIVSVVLFLFSYGPVLLLWGAVLFFPARAVWRRLRKRMTPAN